MSFFTKLRNTVESVAAGAVQVAATVVGSPVAGAVVGGIASKLTATSAQNSNLGKLQMGAAKLEGVVGVGMAAAPYVASAAQAIGIKGLATGVGALLSGAANNQPPSVPQSQDLAASQAAAAQYQVQQAQQAQQLQIKQAQAATATTPTASNNMPIILAGAGLLLAFMK
jgi:hypothetical protein